MCMQITRDLNDEYLIMFMISRHDVFFLLFFVLWTFWREIRGGVSLSRHDVDVVRKQTDRELSNNRELKQATFLSTRTAAGGKLRRYRLRMMAPTVLV